MQAYRFDYATGVYVGPVTLGDDDRDPRHPYRFAVPGDATPVVPPTCHFGFVPVWRGERWTVEPDARIGRLRGDLCAAIDNAASYAIDRQMEWLDAGAIAKCERLADLAKRAVAAAASYDDMQRVIDMVFPYFLAEAR